MNKKIGIFYGPIGGKTENVAQRIKQAFNNDTADLIPIKNSTAADLDKYDFIILGCSTIGMETWDSDRSKPDWDLFRPEFDHINYQGKTFAIFGLGNHITYAAMFVDSMGVIGKILLEKGAKLVGKVPTEGYTFTDSAAVVNNEFLGLPIDEDFEPELTDKRINEWVNNLKKIFK